MDLYSWWTLTADDILACPDQLKLIRLLVKVEEGLRHEVGLDKLKQEQINKLIALIELKYLLQQKLNTSESPALIESLKKCEDEIKKIRFPNQNSFEFTSGEVENCVESEEFNKILEIRQCSNPIITKIVFG